MAWALLWYAAGLVGHSLVEIISRAFYALHDTRTPVIVGIIAMSLNVALSLALSRLFLAIGWMPHGGLALANSIATGLESAALLFLMRRRLAGLEGSRIIAAVWRALLAAALLALTIFGLLRVLQYAPNWIVLGIAAIAGILIYAVFLYILKVDEIFFLSNLLKRKVFAKLFPDQRI